MKFGFVIPWADAEEVGDLAAAAEDNGWDGIFVWEPVWGVDTWISLALAAVRTSTIRLGTMLTPPSRRKPWELASQVATVDRLSGGRVTLAVGLGAIDSGFASFGEECDRQRARRVDGRMPRDHVRALGRAALLVLGQALHRAAHGLSHDRSYRADASRVPIWCVGALGSEKSMSRAWRWDGLIPQVVGDGGARQANLSEIASLRGAAGRPPVRHRDRRPGGRALAGRMGGGRRNMVARDAMGRSRSSRAHVGDLRPPSRRSACSLGRRLPTGCVYDAHVAERGNVQWSAYGAVLFDLDGVITPTASIHEKAWADLFAPWGFTNADYLAYVDGRPRYDGVRTFLAARGVSLPEGDPSDPPGDSTICALGNRKDEMFNAVLAREGIAPYPGSIPVMDSSTNWRSRARSCRRRRTPAPCFARRASKIASAPSSTATRSSSKSPRQTGSGDVPARRAMPRHRTGARRRGRGRQLWRRRRTRRTLRARARRRSRRQPTSPCGRGRRPRRRRPRGDVGVKRPFTTIAIDRERFPVDAWRLLESGRHDDGGLSGTLFAIGNGYLGLRADWAPDPQSAGTYVNGFHETFPIVYPETAHALAKTGQSILNAPDAKSMELTVGGEPLSIVDGADVTDFRRDIDFRTGVLTSRFTWHPRRGGRVDVVSERLVSMTRRHLAALRLSVTLRDDAGPLTLRSLLVNRQDVGVPATDATRDDPRRGRTFDHRVLEPKLQAHDDVNESGGAVTLGFRCMASGMRIAVAARHAVEAGTTPTFDTQLTPDTATTSISIDPRGRRHGDLHEVRRIPRRRPDRRQRRSRRMSSNWQVGLGSRSTTESPPVGTRLPPNSRPGSTTSGRAPTSPSKATTTPQQAIRWNLFQMAQASANVGPRGIAAKAVTAGGYDGHYFWDTEVYVIPMLAYNNPDAARDLLRFRHRTLPQARQRAIEMSQRGALFPWRTLNGEEASAYYPAGTAQFHIDADVAYAIDRYVNATGDTDFLRHEAAEMLVEIARYFADTGFYDSGGSPQFHIHGVTGPDEYTAVVDDNVYTNVMARFALRFAANTVNMLGSHHPADLQRLVDETGLHVDEVAAWTRAADAMCCPTTPNSASTRRTTRSSSTSRGTGTACPPTSTRCCSTSIRS